MTKKTSIIIAIILIGLFLIGAFSALATRTNWPDTPLGNSFPLPPDEGIPELIRYFYEWAIALGGFAAFIALIIAGFQYLSSTGNPAQMNEAKDRIIHAFGGLTLLLASWLILNTINPQFTQLPQLTLNLARLAQLTEDMLAARTGGPPCEFAYICKEKHFLGGCVRMETDTAYNFIQGVKVTNLRSVRQMRHIQCYDYDYENPNPDEEVLDEMLPFLKQVIAICQRDKLLDYAEILSDEELMELDPSLLQCTNNEIIALLEEIFDERYAYYEDPSPLEPVQSCHYRITGDPYDITYNITLKRYAINDGNCSLQLHKGKPFWRCGNRVSEAPGTDRDFWRYTDDTIRCVILVPYEGEN